MTTLKQLQQNKCTCIKKNNQTIPLQQCKLFQCKNWKKCMKKTNNQINKELKKLHRKEAK